VVVVIFPNAQGIALFLAICFIALYADWFYIRHYKKRKLRYPIVPPEGKGDIYSRASIPRPIYEDFRRMQEKRKKFGKLNKLLRRMKKKKG
jgi:hypothetical protein